MKLKSFIKFIVLICSVDSKARAQVLNMSDLNGEFGCTFFYSKCENRVYPVSTEITLRTDADLRKKMREAFETKSVIKGVKGPSFLASFPEFNLSTGMVVDSMHNVYRGIMKHLTELILKTKIKNRCIGNSTNLRRINNRLLKIKPPSKISRKPRNINTRGSWKTSEWRNWLLYYCLPCLKNIILNEKNG